MRRDILRIENLSKEFKGLKAVKNVDLTVKEGEILGLIGPNGAGKTTFFNCIAGYYTDYQGKITYGEIEITGKKAHEICKHGIVRTFQIVRPFGNLSVFENVMVGAYNLAESKAAAEKLAEEAISFAGMADMADKTAADLNIGDQRRLELARALAAQPKLLLLDEVMAGLNPIESEQVMGLIRKIREKGITVLMVEHIMAALMQLSDRVLVLDAGERIALGTPEEVSNDERVIESYLGAEI